MFSRLNRSASALLLVSLVLSGCGGTPEQKEARYLKRGNELLARGKFEKARVEYRNAARLKPTDADVLYHLGLVDDAEGNFREAYLSFTRAEQQDKNFHPALLKLAEYYLAAGQYDQADQRIDTVLADAPGDPQAHALLAARLLKQKKYDEAESETRKSLSADPNNVLAFAILAGLYRAQNNLPKALATVEDGVARNPKDETLLRIRAELYEQQGDLAKTALAYQALFDAAPLEKKYRLQLADDYVKAGQADQAEAILRAGVAALPEDWEMKHQLVLFLDGQRGLGPAEQEIRQYLASDPDRPEPIDWLVNLYLAHKREEQVVSFLDQIIAQNKYDQLWLGAMASRARIDYLKGDRDDADKRIAQVLAKDPNNLNAQFIKTHIEADQGADGQAVIDLRSIIRDKPKAVEAYQLLSEVLLRQGHTDLAIETLNQLAEVVPLDVQQQVRLAQLYALNGDPRHAMDLLFMTTKTDPDYSVGWETTARLALELKDWSTANVAIDTLDAMPGQHPTALLLRGEQKALTGKMAEAIADYSAVIALDPAAPQAEHALGALVQAYRGQGQLPEAARYLETLKPQTPSIDTMLGQCYAAMGNTDKAAAAFDRAIAGHASRQDPYLERAGLFLRQHKNDEALATLDQAIKIDAADMRAPLAKAQMLEQFGQYQPAIDLYSDLLAKHPDSDLVANNIAELIADHTYTDRAQLEQARQIAERFTASSNPLLLDTLGWVYFRQDRTQDALAVLERAFRLSDRLPPQMHYHYGAVLWSLGRHDQAQAELRQATANNPVYPGADDAAKLFSQSH